MIGRWTPDDSATCDDDGKKEKDQERPWNLTIGEHACTCGRNTRAMHAYSSLSSPLHPPPERQVRRVTLGTSSLRPFMPSKKERERERSFSTLSLSLSTSALHFSYIYKRDRLTHFSKSKTSKRNFFSRSCKRREIFVIVRSDSLLPNYARRYIVS